MRQQPRAGLAGGPGLMHALDGAVVTVVHAAGICTTFERPEPLEGLPVAAEVPGGRLVSCPVCYNPGVVPEPGQLGRFLPPGATYDAEAGTVLWRFRV